MWVVEPRVKMVKGWEWVQTAMLSVLSLPVLNSIIFLHPERTFATQKIRRRNWWRTALDMHNLSAWITPQRCKDNKGSPSMVKHDGQLRKVTFVVTLQFLCKVVQSCQFPSISKCRLDVIFHNLPKSTSSFLSITDITTDLLQSNFRFLQVSHEE